MKYLLTLFSIFTLASAQHRGPSIGGGPDHKDVEMIKKWKLIEFLDISENQSDKFFTRINSFEEEMKAIRKKEKDLRESIHELMDEDKLNQKKVEKLMDGFFDFEKEKLNLRQEHHADMDNILKFHARYPDAITYKIETNYRSQPEILELSNAAISANTEQIQKKLTASRKGGEMVPALLALADPRAQADFVAQRVQELVDDGIEEEEIAVLYRAHYHSMEIQMEFTSRMIPFKITSGLRFFEQAHVKDVSSYIRFVVNRRDEVSFKRMVLTLPGVGDASADKLWRGWKSSDAAKSESIPESFTKTLLEFKVPAKAKTHWEQMCYTLDELVLIDGDDGTKLAAPADMIYSILEGVYEEYMKNAFDNYENRKQDIGQLQNYATQYTDVMEFLAQLSLMSTVDGDPTKKKQDDDKGVTLSSIHQAKGLEWKVVFLIWLADGMFPNGKILEAEDNKMLEEERRLFYVALTRAKDQLYLSYPMMNPRSYSGEVFQHPSRFLDDFPPELVDEWKVSGW